MAIAVMILSDEGGRDTVTTIAASREEAEKAGEVLSRSPARKTLGIETEQAIKFIGRAWDVIGKRWEQEHAEKRMEVTP